MEVNVLGLLESCPFDLCNPIDCPLYRLRLIDPPQQLAWLDLLSIDELEYLACYHYVCLKAKIEAENALEP